LNDGQPVYVHAIWTRLVTRQAADYQK